MEIFVWTFTVLYVLQVVFGIWNVSENKGIVLSPSELAWRTMIKFCVVIWAVYLLSR